MADTPNNTDHVDSRAHEDVDADLEEVYGRITDAFLALDADARVTYLNERAERLLGLPAEELLGEVIWEALPDDFAETFREDYATAMGRQEPIEREKHYPFLDRWYEIRAYPSESGLSVYFRDITDRKRTEQQLDHQREQLAAINQLNTVIQEITHAVIDTPSREEIERQVCERLVDADSYAFVWLGHVNRGNQEVTPSCMAGSEEGSEDYLEEITISISSDHPSGRGPTGTAIRTREPQFVQDTLADPDYEPWRAQARERDFRSSAAIPIIHDGVLYGVVNVYTPRSNAFTLPEREALTHLGEVVGHAIHAIEQHEALTSDTVLELEFRNEGIADLVTSETIADDEAEDDSESGVAISIERTVPSADGSMLQFGTVSGMSGEQFTAAVSRLPTVDEVTLLAGDDGDTDGDTDEELLFELTVSEPSMSGVLASHGGRILSLTITADEMRLIAELPPNTDTRAVTEAIEDIYPGTELLAQRTTARETISRSELYGEMMDRLTDKQRAALEASYFAGYFDWPRTSTGREIAAMLGVSQPTFTQHLRTAHRKLLASLYDDDR